MGVFCQISVWRERQEPGEGACGKAGLVSFPVGVVSSPIELAFSRVEKSYLPGYTSRDLPMWIVVWFGFFFPMYI